MTYQKEHSNQIDALSDALSQSAKADGKFVVMYAEAQYWVEDIETARKMQAPCFTPARRIAVFVNGKRQDN